MPSIGSSLKMLWRIVQGLLEFLAYEPFYDNRSWNQVVLRKHESGLERLLPLCSLLKGVMLRRTKQDVGAHSWIVRQNHLLTRLCLPVKYMCTSPSLKGS